MTLIAATIVLIACLVGVAMTLLVLPGIWLMILVAIGCWIWQGEMFSWWTMVVAVGLALLAELLELIASAAGARRTGGTRKAATAAVVGSIVGAIVGTPVLPIIGTILGAMLGAGLAALMVERGLADKDWRTSAKVGAGAAAGRLVATLIKGGLALVIAIILSVAAFV